MEHPAHSALSQPLNHDEPWLGGRVLDVLSERGLSESSKVLCQLVCVLALATKRVYRPKSWGNAKRKCLAKDGSGAFRNIHGELFLYAIPRDGLSFLNYRGGGRRLNGDEIY